MLLALVPICLAVIIGVSGPAMAQVIDLQTQGSSDASESPLRSARTTSPRATLFSFLETLDEAYAAGAAGDHAASTRLVEQAVFHFDLSEVPDQVRRIRSAEAALKLKEVLDRIPLPERGAVPSRAEATGQTRESGIIIGGAAAAETVPITLWQIPGSNVQIHRVAEGPRAGEYLFSPSTFAQVADWYESIRDAPYLRTNSPGIYIAYAHSPGRSINTRFIETTPAWLQQVWGEQTIWQWVGLVLTLVLALSAARYTLALGRRADGWHASRDFEDFGGPRWRLGSLTALLLCLGYATLAADVVDDRLNLTGKALGRVDFSLSLAAWIAFGSFAFLACRQAFELVVYARRLKPIGAQAQLIRLVGFFVAGFILAMVFVVADEDFGLPGYSIVTGLGVGGIAVSLAARETLSDLFGSFVIMTERPYGIGDFIDVGGQTGTVEAIGFRSTRLRTTSDLVIFIPNASISRSLVTNYGFRQKFLIDTAVRIEETTLRDKVEVFLESARAKVSALSSVVAGSTQIHLHDFKPGNLEVMVYLSIDAENWSGSLRQREAVLLAIMQAAEETDVQLAPPQISDT